MQVLVKLEFLKAINILACIVHLALTVSVAASLDLWKGVEVVRLTFNVTVEDSKHKVLPNGFSSGNFRYAFVLFMVEAVTCLFHFSLAFPLYRRYMQSISQCNNSLRWIEYTFTASAMFLLISFSCGVVEVEFLVTLTTLMVTTMLFGLIQEFYNRPANKDEWLIDSRFQRCLPLICGFVPFTAAYTLVLKRLFEITSSDFVELDGGSASNIPGFVYVIVFGELFMFLGFPVIMVMQVLSRPRQYTSY